MDIERCWGAGSAGSFAGRPARSVRRGLRLGCAALVVCALGACARQPAEDVSRLPPPTLSTTVGPGDLLRIKIVGESELPDEYQVASDGTVELPYLGALKVEAMEPHAIAAAIREQLRERKILIEPTVVVSVGAYQSKRVTLSGEVDAPGSFVVTRGMTLSEVLSVAGGLTPLAEAAHVRITRLRADGQTVTVEVDVDAINNGGRDIPMQAGDRVFVPTRTF